MFKGGYGMANTGTLCISIIILVIVIILIVMVCYNYNQTQNTQTQQYTIQNPGLAAAAVYHRKNNFANYAGPICPEGQNPIEIMVIASCNTSNKNILNCKENTPPIVNYRCGVADNCPNNMTVQKITMYCGNNGCYSGKTSISCQPLPAGY